MMTPTPIPSTLAVLQRRSFCALLSGVICITTLSAAEEWRGTYDWGKEVHAIALSPQWSGKQINAIAYTAAYRAGDSCTGTITVTKHTADGHLVGHTDVDGDSYRFTGSVSATALTGRFARKEFDEWLDEGGIKSTPVRSANDEQQEQVVVQAKQQPGAKP